MEIRSAQSHAFVVGSAVDQHIKLDGLFHEVVHVVKAHRLLGQHQRFLTGRLDVIGHVQFGVGIERSGRGARFGRKLERTDHVEPKVVHKAPQLLKVLVGLPGEPNNKCGSNRHSRNTLTEFLQQLNLLLTGGPAPHQIQDWSGHVLQRDIDVFDDIGQTRNGIDHLVGEVGRIGVHQTPPTAA